MHSSINYKIEYDKALLYLLDKLPKAFSQSIISFLEKQQIHTVNEIRINACAYVILTFNNKVIITDVKASKELIDEIIISLCDGSIYTHFDTIKDGYINVGNGIRAGICGKAALKNTEINGIYDISSINIRIPQRILNAGKELFEYLKKNNFSNSAIIFSPPGVGKTTVLRDLVSRLSYEKIRCAVIDSREEITPFLKEKANLDVFLSYPKDVAIDMATKTMTPQIIVCDEITTNKEVESIKYTVNSGVSFIATTHARSFEGLKSKAVLKPLFDMGAFDVAIGIKRNFQNKFIFEFTELT